ncbi:MAG: CotH kinase family protein [Opitutaceae bacterium]|nr:CotH kinase family protein [Opitutaceae bacterium]
MRHVSKFHRVRSSLILLLTLATASLQAAPVISEFMASNATTLADEDGAYSDWIEIHNPDGGATDLSGWFLTDSATNKTKWQFPSVVLPAGGHLVVFASGKDRRIPGAMLHTNFSLNAQGEYLALVRPDGSTVTTEFAPKFPQQTPDVAYGLAPNANGSLGNPAYLSRPTPGAANAPAGSSAMSETAAFSRVSGPFTSGFTLQLSGAHSGQHIRYIMAQPTSGAVLAEPTATSPIYTGPIPVNTSVVIRAAVFSADGTNTSRTTTAAYTKISPGLAGFSSKLPLLVLDTMGSGPLVKDGINHASWLNVYDPQTSGWPSFSDGPSFTAPLTATVRGSSSAEFPKKSYTLSLTDSNGAAADHPLLNLPANNKWALIGPWSFDFSYINNSFLYTLSNRIGRWAPRTKFAEVFFNANGGDLDPTDYAGIYVLTERIELGADRVNLKPLSGIDLTAPAITGGYILKIDSRDPDEIGWLTHRGIPENGQSSVVLVYPKASDAAPAQVDYIRNYVQSMEDALYADSATGFAQRTYLDYLDRSSWVDHHILNTFSCNPDALVKSAYFTKDRGGKLAAGPIWDFDRAFGSYWDERSFRWDTWFGLGGTDVWNTGWWGVLARDPEFMQEWVDRWQSLRKGELSNSSLIKLVGEQGAEIGPEAAARDAARWPDNAPAVYGTHTGQIDHLKGWVTVRAQWIDRQFLAAPAVMASGSTITFTAPAGAKLVYTLDGSDPRSLGGDVAPGAMVTTASLTVAANTNVHVRSYREDLRDTFPGSPWSSAVGGDASTPLTPRSRLINLSSRAIAGTGEDALVAGVVVADTTAKRYLARGIGPGLTAFGVPGALPDPLLKVSTGTGRELARNLGWQTGSSALSMGGYAQAVGAFPLSTGVRDSALSPELPSGTYTVEVTPASGQPGLSLAELYELDDTGRTVNLSTRARVRSGAGVLIGGFVVQGAASKRMLIRAVGPTLGAFGVAGTLADPVLTVYSGSTPIAANDRWGAAENAAAIVAASTRAGAFQLAGGSEDAAMLITLPPGPYTVEVKGKAGAEGVALLEIYEVP